jgi:acyl carrier protein
MAIQASDIIAVMREVGISPALIERIDPAGSLAEQGLDSIDFPMIAVAVQKQYGVDLSDADASVLRSIDAFVAFVNQRLG